MKETHSKAETIIVSISMVVLAGLFVNIGNVFAILFRIDNQVYINLVLIFSSLIGFVAIPLLYYLEFKPIKPKFYIISAIVLSVLILFISIFIFQSEEIVHALIIATCEEFLFRVIILSVLLSCFKKRGAFVLGSLIFAILLHLNGNFFVKFRDEVPS